MRWRLTLVQLMTALVMAVSITGCWDQHPVEYRATVAAIAIDPSQSPGHYVYTFLFPNATTTTSSLESTPRSEQFYTIKVSAASLSQAVGAVQNRQSRSLYLGQLRLLVLSTRLPTAQWMHVLNGVADSGQFVLTFWVIAAKSASAVVSLTPPTEVVPEVALYQALRCKCQSFRWQGSAWRAWTQAHTPGMNVSFPYVIPESGHPVLGRIVVLGARPIQWNQLQTEGYAYLDNRITRDAFSVYVHHSPMAVTEIRGRSSVRVVRKGPRIIANVRLRYSGELLSGTIGDDNSHTIRQVEQAAANKIQESAVAAWRESVATNMDPMGFHRLALWTDSRISPNINWSQWELHTTVSFTLRNAGTLR
jgi:hypothetical protein